MLCGVCLLTGCSSSGRAASCLIFPFSTMGLNSTTLNFISFSLEFSIHFLWLKEVIKEIFSRWRVLPVLTQTHRKIRGFGNSLHLSYPKTKSLMSTAIAHRHLFNLKKKKKSAKTRDSTRCTNNPFYTFVITKYYFLDFHAMVKDHFFLILSAMLLKNRSVFSFLQFYVLQDDCMTATYSQFSGGIYFFSD